MPEHLRALVVILAVSALVFLLVQKPLCPGVVNEQEFKRRRNLWFAMTFIAFLSHNFWAMCLLCGVVAALGVQRDSNPLALYFGLLFAVPPFGAQIPGVGPINYFFDLNYIRLLNLCILLPAASRILMQRESPRGGHRATDILVSCHLGLIFVLTLLVSNFTGTARQGFLLILDVALPYYVASRLPLERKALREIAGAIVISAAVLAATAIFEFARRWLLYSALDDALGLRWTFGHYLARGDGGALRALASTGHSIVLGYLMMVGIAFLIAIEGSIRPRAGVAALGVLLLAGLVASLSRGPWVGALAMLVFAWGIGPGAGKRVAWLLGGCCLLVIIGALSPWGSSIVDHLPFVGSVDEGSVTYRQQLFNVSMVLVWQNPVFGSYDYLYNPIMEQMRQGEGIIDMVNTYLGVALSSGLVGVALFVTPFVGAGIAVEHARRSVVSSDLDADSLGRALLGALVGVAVTIATVSPISSIPTIYWLVIGLCIAYARLFGGEVRAALSSPQSRGSATKRAAPLGR